MQVVAHEEVQQGLLAIFVMLQHCSAVEAQQLAAEQSNAVYCCLLYKDYTTIVPGREALSHRLSYRMRRILDRTRQKDTPSDI